MPAGADGILVRGEKSGAVKRLPVAIGLIADGNFGHAAERAVIGLLPRNGTMPVVRTFETARVYLEERLQRI